MLNRVELQGFRGFEELEVPRLSRINLFTGRNNSGKTALLEALFLLSGAGNPQTALNANMIRGFDLDAGSAVPETFWKPMFTDFDLTRTVRIGAHHESLGTLALNIMTEDADTSFELPLEGSSRLLVRGFSNTTGLLFSFRKGSQEETQGRIRIAAGGIQVVQPGSPPPFGAIILSSGIGNFQEDAMRLGQLRRIKQGGLLVEALRIVEPRLQGIEDNTASGVPMIWGDIGLPELVPLQAMGEGMTRIARLILAISAVPDGIVLVDEIENGLHHSVLSKVWCSIEAAAERFNTQIVASTHSFECMEAAHRSLGERSLLVHRLEDVDGTMRCICYGPDQIGAAISHDLEVR